MLGFAVSYLALEGGWHFTACKLKDKAIPPCIFKQVKTKTLQTTVEWSSYKDEQKDKKKEMCICLEYLLPTKKYEVLKNWQISRSNSESVITGEMHRIIMSDGFHYFAATE